MNKNIILSLTAVLLLIGVGSAYASEGFGEKRTMRDSENFSLVQEALENRDYESWSELMDGRGAGKRITEDNFNQFVEMHDLFLEGKTEEAKVIKDELGMGMRMGVRKGMGRGVRDGMRRGMGRGLNK